MPGIVKLHSLKNQILNSLSEIQKAPFSIFVIVYSTSSYVNLPLLKLKFPLAKKSS